ncbi:hypothetical protein [uncultured Roseobacter sp.]|uniref:hypothetical protein n=1 Tax=uncultured Roseobacter sp. TaxID=114847 RepID=UPI002608AFF3|nr:hypothetical protein [uncultured Roseobacter sp.]
MVHEKLCVSFGAPQASSSFEHDLNKNGIIFDSFSTKAQEAKKASFRGTISRVFLLFRKKRGFACENPSKPVLFCLCFLTFKAKNSARRAVSARST